ncbi:MAG: DUF1848 domain-containing protein [Planctomycetaceae bacterium]|jgi:DNA repair photolyase|nr:DUF1848 domain-containing protein [Planctomycetaceae bacterium]
MMFDFLDLEKLVYDSCVGVGGVGGILPVVISASRATDIPAFYGDWFMTRLRAGCCVWLNPFNRKKYHVSFQNLRAIIFWTKNPEPFFCQLDELYQMGLTYYFQFTLNNYEKENFEPDLPPLAKRIELFQKLSERLGRDRVIWRFDPILVTDNLSVFDVLDRLETIGNALAGFFTDKLVFSFVDVDNYFCVKRKIRSLFPKPRELSITEMQQAARQISEYNKKWRIEVASCCEETDLSGYGIEANSCVDAELLRRLAPNDLRLLSFLSRTKKDKGQRKNCGCIVSKDIGQYNTCRHNCIYCYANKSAKSVSKDSNHYK